MVTFFRKYRSLAEFAARRRQIKCNHFSDDMHIRKILKSHADQVPQGRDKHVCLFGKKSQTFCQFKSHTPAFRYPAKATQAI